MVRGRSLRTLLALVAASLLPLLSTSIAPAVPLAGPAVAAGTDFIASGSSEGGVGCAGFIVPPACDQWIAPRPPGSTSWLLTEHREGSGEFAESGAYTETADIKLDIQESQTADGHFQSATIKAQLKASAKGGGEGHANATYGLSITTDGDYALAVSGTGGISAKGSTKIISTGQIQLEVECGEQDYHQEAESAAGTSASNSDTDSFGAQATVEATEDEPDCVATLNLHLSSSSNQPAKDESGSAELTFNGTISVVGAAPTPEGCDGITGVVEDGLPPGHHHRLSGVRVQLYKDGGPRGGPVKTEPDGSFCIHRGNGVDAGDYKVRATLVDESRNPPLFETRYQDGAEAVFVEKPVTLEASGAAIANIAFADDSARPWLSDVADIHWQASRFVDWLTSPAGLGYQPQTIGSFTIRTFDTDPQGTRYIREQSIVVIATADSPFAERDDIQDQGPENDEWHEIGHHLEKALGIAVSPGPICHPRVNHAGWSNPSTCDSVLEGFAVFLPTLGSLTIEAAQPTLATTWYSHFADLESQSYRPWSTITGADGRQAGREDFAVAQLLWDIADAHSDGGEVRLAGSPALRPLADNIATGGAGLVDLLRIHQVNTVAELYQALALPGALAPTATSPSVDLDDDGTKETSDLDQVFLMHGFHPIIDLNLPAFKLGDPVSRTDHVPNPAGGLVARPHIEEVVGSNVRLQNGTSDAVTFTVEVTGLGEAWHDEVAVAAGTQRDLYVELPPYYQAALGPEASLPPCGADDAAVTLNVTAPGADPKALSSCDYAHAATASTDGAALTYKVGTGAIAAASSGPSGPSAPGEQAGAPGLPPVALALIVSITAVALLAIGYIGIRRTRRQG